MVFQGSSQPRFEKRNLPPDLCSKCRLPPSPAGCALRPDVSPPCHRAALRVRFPTAPLASMMKFSAAVDGRALDVLEDDSTSL